MWILCFLAIFSGGVTAQNLRVVSIEHEPFLIRSDDPTKSGNDRFSGFIPDLLEALKEELDYSYTLMTPSDGKYGMKGSNGVWNGMVGMAQKNEADMIAADLTQTPERSEVLEFTTPFMTNPLTLLLKRTVGSGLSVTYFLAPFTAVTWVVALVALLVTSLLLWLVARISPQEKKNQQNKEITRLDGALWYILGSFFRGSNYTPKAWSARLVVLAWWIFGIVFVLTYLATLSALAAPSAGLGKMSSTAEAVDNTRKFLVVNGGATSRFLKSTKIPLLKVINSRTEYLDNAVDMATAVAESEGEVAAVMEGVSAGFHSSRDCRLYSVGNLNERAYALAFRKGSRYAANPDFSRAIMRLQESGKISELRNRWWGGRVCEEQSGGAQGLYGKAEHDIDDMAAVFILLGILLVIAVVLSLVELLWNSKKSSKQEGGTGKAFTKELKEAVSGTKSEKEPLKKDDAEATA